MTQVLMHHDRFDAYGLVGAQMNTTDAAEALRLADLDWDVVTGTAHSTVILPDGVVTEQFAHKRTTNRVNADGAVTPLGVVGHQYEAIQNRETIGLLQRLVDSSDATFTAAGHTHGGRRTFVVMELPEGLQVGNLDPMRTRIVVVNWHDGTGKLRAIPTAERLFCTNQFPSLQRSEFQFAARHVAGSLEVGLDQIRKALDLSFETFGEIKRIGDELVNIPMNARELEQIAVKIYGDPAQAKTEKAVERQKGRQRQLVDIFTGAKNLADVRGTAWAGLQTFIEYEDWFKTRRNDGRATAIVTHTSDDVKLRALELIRSI